MKRASPNEEATKGYLYWLRVMSVLFFVNLIKELVDGYDEIKEAFATLWYSLLIIIILILFPISIPVLAFVKMRNTRKEYAERNLRDTNKCGRAENSSQEAPGS